MATRIKPDAADTVGMTAMYAKIGVDVKNAVTYVTNFNYTWGQDQITFEAKSFYNNAALNQHLLDNTVEPFKNTEYILFNGIDPNKSLINQCLDYLLALPQYNGSQGGGSLPWVKA